jgi:IS605 OrfB family transposase
MYKDCQLEDRNALDIVTFRERILSDTEQLLYAHDANHAVDVARQNFASYLGNGSGGERPDGNLGSFLEVCSCCTSPDNRVEVVRNDRGYGLRVKLRPRSDPFWWHVQSGPYQDEYLDSLVTGDLDYGNLQIELQDGQCTGYLTVTHDIEVPTVGSVPTYLGVDLGENNMYAGVVVEDESVEDVTVRSGDEFRHYRRELDARKNRLQAKGDLRGVHEISGERERYTEHVVDTATREIVDMALEHRPCAIRLEDLTDYRKTADNPIHDWPYSVFKEQILYKAKSEEIPVEVVNPRATSITCRKCGDTNRQYRRGDDFSCSCGYQVHADVNAAINIANGGVVA